MEKIKELLSSIRFYVVTFAWLSQYLSKISADGFDVVILFEQISLWLGTVVTIGTIDSVIYKIKE